jgi:hypothetical protein
MRPIDIFGCSLVILLGLTYAISCIVTQKASWRGQNYEGKNARAAGWAILFIFVCVALGFAYALIYLA